MTEAELAAIEARAKAAHDEIRRLCVGEGRIYEGERGRVIGRRFTMSIPVRADDSDVLLHAPIQDLRAMDAEIRRLRAVVDHLRDFRDYRGPDVQGAWSELAKHLSEIDGTPPAQD